VVASVVALGFVAFVPTSATASSAQAAKKATINTFKVWDGASTVTPFGCPDSSTYGTTITVPNSKHAITKFTVYMNDGGATGSMKARGEVYAWDGTKATGSAIAETAKTIDLQNANFNPVSVKFKNAALTPGSQYVVFFSIDKDYEACTNYTTSWGSTDGSAYTGGIFVFQNNTGNEANWTTQAWSQIPSLDAAMKVFLK